MPFFQLTTDDLSFPPGYFADSEGLIAVGGDLKAPRVIEGYRNGIHFWFGPMDPIKWWSPDPRLVLFPGQVELDPEQIPHEKISVQLGSTFESTLRALQTQENHGEMGPHWVTEEMIQTYIGLNEQGKCVVLEVVKGGNLIGSVLGIVLGGVFFIEHFLNLSQLQIEQSADLSVFGLSEYLDAHDFRLIDIQKETVRISDIGIVEISRLEYLDHLKKGIVHVPKPFNT
jgi:leucyl/phenylalanyl-tRNA--protein transferase